MNHCFDDVERFMARLQQTAEAQTILNQRRKKRSRKNKKKEDHDGESRPIKEVKIKESCLYVDTPASQSLQNETQITTCKVV